VYRTHTKTATSSKQHHNNTAIQLMSVIQSTRQNNEKEGTFLSFTFIKVFKVFSFQKKKKTFFAF